MSFGAKLRRIGNSIGVILPSRVITGYNIGDVIELEVITKDKNVITPIGRIPPVVITSPLKVEIQKEEPVRIIGNPRIEKPANRFTGELTKARQTSRKGFNE